MILATMFLFVLFIPAFFIFGQENEFIDLDFQDFWISKSTHTYAAVKCPNGTNTISYYEIINNGKRLLGALENKTTVWVNASAVYTSWVIYKGIFNIASRNIVNSTYVSNVSQFIECYKFCSVYSWRYIGLQEDMCFCISADGLRNGNHIKFLPTVAKICSNGDIMYCSIRNKNYSMVVYEKDDNKYEGHGECLRSKIKMNLHVLSAASHCDTDNTDILCIHRNLSGKYTGIFEPRTDVRLTLCEAHNYDYVDFNKLNTTKITNGIWDHDYLLNNFRKSIFLQPGQALHAHCTTTRAFDGRINLQITDCKNKRHALCIRNNRFLEHTTNNEIKTVSRNYTTPDIKKRDNIGYAMYLIPPLVGGIFLAVLSTVIYRWKYMKYESTRSSTIHSEVAQTESLGIITNPVRDSTARSEHEYTEVGLITDMAILSNVEDTDDYLVPHQSKSQQKSIVLSYDRDNERVIRENNGDGSYINELPMYQMESFNLYQPLEEEGQSCKHLYTRITNQAS